MSSFDYVKLYWKRYGDFSGRSRRSEVFIPLLVNFLFCFPLALFSLIPFIGLMFVVCLFLTGVVLFIPTLAVYIRRMHDLGKPGSYVLFALIPFVGLIILLVFLATDSEPGTNQYGTSVKYPYGRPTPPAANWDVQYEQPTNDPATTYRQQHGRWLARKAGQPWSVEDHAYHAQYEQWEHAQRSPSAASEAQPAAIETAHQGQANNDAAVAYRQQHDQWLASKAGQPWSAADHAYQAQYQQWNRAQEVQPAQAIEHAAIESARQQPPQDAASYRQQHDQWLASRSGQPWSSADHAYQAEYDQWELTQRHQITASSGTADE